MFAGAQNAPPAGCMMRDGALFLVSSFRGTGSIAPGSSSNPAGRFFLRHADAAQSGGALWIRLCAQTYIPAACFASYWRTSREQSRGCNRKQGRVTIRATLTRLNARLWRAAPAAQPAEAEEPLRAELFSAEQMERHGMALAESHRLASARGNNLLLERLDTNEAALVSAWNLVMAAVKENRRITPAGEWLLDNFYLIEEQIRTARRHFPRGYSRELPLLAGGPSAGLPRVYDIGLEAISHGDGRVDPDSLNRFVAAYQKGADLRLGELWAIPIMLRLALLENLRRVAMRVAAGMTDRNLADDWADRMMAAAENDPKSLILVIADMARSNPPLTNSFVAALARRLQGRNSALALPLTWIEQHLSESGLTIEHMVQSETQSQAANQVSIGNSIGSLRFLGAMDWRDFVEAMSSVEHKLREDPVAIYARMDFATRDRYRHAVERIARRTSASENEVARKAVWLAHQGKAAGSDGDEAAAHVGYYLVDSGLARLEAAVEARRSPLDTFKALGRAYPLPLYLGGIAIATLVMAGVFLRAAAIDGMPAWLLAMAILPAMLAASQLAVTMVNWLATLVATPHALPRMDFSKGIPRESRTLVVVPTMLASAAGVAALVEELEVRYLANRDGNLHFGLLTDFPDAAFETIDADAPLLQLAEERVAALNLKYDRFRRETFFLLHRPRLWNAGERIWMGYERKRGKLADLNKLLRHGSRTAFALVVGETAILRRVKYVITLDTDTQLPRDSAREFAATMAHPLNRARGAAGGGAAGGCGAGYGILQPRIAVTLPSTNRSRYAGMCNSTPGLDPYTRAVSDVYQDLFHEGSFIGKGIYDVDAFEEALENRFPENRILSHDLLEGCYARAGLISDVQLFEDTPARYRSEVARRHRWIRGDWQIASWLLKRVPGPDATRCPNSLSKLSQWKILDNLRRSLVPGALIFLLLLGWSAPPTPLNWSLAVIAVLFLPTLAGTLLKLLRKPADIGAFEHVKGVLRASAIELTHSLFMLACLPYEAFYTLGAIMRTSARVLVTRRRLLEWIPSAELQRAHESGRRAPPGGLVDLLHTCGAMWIAPASALAGAALLAATRPHALAAAAPVLGLWLAAPVLAWWVSRPLIARQARLSEAQNLFLRKLGRRTWSFFEDYVTAADHWLPPDNYQEHPVATLAHRTSPTNMGLALLANLAAHDFGTISCGRLINRSSDAIETMRTLARHRGHFYNWYDTLTLLPLSPLYISSVDSGNLAGHLLTLRSGLAALADAPIVAPRTFESLGDTVRVLADAAPAGPAAHIDSLRRAIDSACDAAPATLEAACLWLDRLAAESAPLAGRLDVTAGATEAARWARALHAQILDARDDLVHIAPWLNPGLAATERFELPGLGAQPTLRDLAALAADYLAATGAGATPAIGSTGSGATPASGSTDPRALATLGQARAQARIAAIGELALHAGELAEMDFDFLYDRERHLFTVGYNVDQQRRDAGHYDLLASEARLTSFVAIAQGCVPQESWFALGRLLTNVNGDSILLSWSGSMFEYLMPLLVMPEYANTLLAQTSLGSVRRQIAYGGVTGKPWGISESGYNAVDSSLNYQYRAFGVPGLGLKRGLAEDLVVTPYASALALMVSPAAACQNLQRLAADGLAAGHGMYEAVDYTPSRLPRGQSAAVVRSFMAHHQGMMLLSLAHLLCERPMQRRFAADPLIKATMLLLQERVPAATVFHFHIAELSDTREAQSGPAMPMRVLASADTPVPEVQLLSNGRYHVMVTNAGGGYSRWKDLAVTRWREDATRDNWGSFCYLRDVASGETWSAAHQPTGREADAFEAIFSEARAEFRRSDLDYETHTEIVVSPEDDIELRRLHIVNRARTRRTIEVTSYAEVVLATPAADALHPAFSNLFVETEILTEAQAIVCRRRPRSQGEKLASMFHLMAIHGGKPGAASFETDRMRFIGRTRDVAAPAALDRVDPLSGSAGSVLDPIVAIRCQVTIEAGAAATIDLVTGIGETPEAVLSLIGKYRDRRLADRVFDLAWTHSWVNLQQINASESDAQLYARLAGSIVYANPLMRADAGVLLRNRRGQSGLWGYAISGDLPIVLLTIGDAANIELVRQLVQAHFYWRLKGLAVDLVIWNEEHAGYRQALQEQITGLIAAGVEAHANERPGGIFVRAAEQISGEDRVLFQTVARVIISDTRGALAEQINRRAPRVAREAPLPRAAQAPRAAIREAGRAPTPAPAQPAPESLRFFNGHGGFSADGREYVVTSTRGQTTPAPWVNVLANAAFGTVISESGASYTWCENAHEFRFTPWGNDPVGDSCGEALYIRDEESGNFWSPTLLPCGGTAPHVARHGFGYSVFTHVEDGIASELTVHVDCRTALKFSVLRLSNQSGRHRRLSATGYVEWVLGDLRARAAMHVVTEIDPGSGAICARNPYSTEFPDRVAFFDAAGATLATGVSFTGDRGEFLGRNGSTSAPAAMARARLSGRVGAGMDPCAAIQIPLELAAGQSREVVFRLGAAGRRGTDDAASTIKRQRNPEAARESLEAVREQWAATLGAVQVETPDEALNLLANGWLIYQTMACRLWARSGFYQSGGAFGFRDQLQDAMALVHCAPAALREQILLAASRQFVEGDVQHWWHPPAGRGVRTHCSDDLLWLPQALCRYVEASGDRALMDQTVHFLEGRALSPGDDSYYDLPARSETSATLYEHCVRAIARALSFGTHGLPLMGSGDWNDGMNLVGIAGRGESVWLGFFLYDTLERFGALAHIHGDSAQAELCRQQAATLRRNLEQHGWDGQWYLRAWFDDGGALGSAANTECRIDSIPQSWAVLSGAADPARARQAMDSLDQHLVRRDHALIQLLDPPFDKSALDPGYIRGYVPGVRENGGQYTHAAIWAAMAFAAQGDTRRAWELFDMINPVNHARDADAAAIYKVEPYVIAADVYAAAAHAGRGGWTWYTGSAGWMVRLILESLLGVRRAGATLHFAPCLPDHWPGFRMVYRHGATPYTITVTRDGESGSPAQLRQDGAVRDDGTIALVDDGIEHAVALRLAKPVPLP